MSDTTQQSESAASEHESVGRGSRRRLQGRIVSDTHKPGRAKKTVVVEVQRKRYHAHDEKEQFRTNDVVEIEESRPLSATKRWVTIRLISRPEEV